MTCRCDRDLIHWRLMPISYRLFDQLTRSSFMVSGTGAKVLGVAIRKVRPVDIDLLGGLTAAKDAAELCWNDE